MTTATLRLIPAWQKLNGISEVAGAASNPRIVAMMRGPGKGGWVKNDGTPWCGGAQAQATVDAGLSEFLPDNPLRARDWLTVGREIPIEDAQPDDVVVFPRGGNEDQGHVGTIGEVHPNHLMVWAGNQSPGRDRKGNLLPDQVCLKKFPRRGAKGPIGVRRLEQSAGAAAQNAGRIPASIRNKNPGAQYPGPSATKFGSVGYEVLRSKDGQHLIATFPTSEQGAAAMFDLLASDLYVGKTIRAAITKWCGGFSAATYVAALQARAGVSPETILTRELVKYAAFAIPLAKAMAFHEADTEYPLSDERWRVAHAMAFPETVPKKSWWENYRSSRSMKLKTNGLLATLFTIGTLVYNFFAGIAQWLGDNIDWLMHVATGAVDKADEIASVGQRMAEHGVPWPAFISLGVLLLCLILGMLDTSKRETSPKAEDVLNGPDPQASAAVPAPLQLGQASGGGGGGGASGGDGGYVVSEGSGGGAGYAVPRDASAIARQAVQ